MKLALKKQIDRHMSMQNDHDEETNSLDNCKQTKKTLNSLNGDQIDANNIEDKEQPKEIDHETQIINLKQEYENIILELTKDYEEQIQKFQ